MEFLMKSDIEKSIEFYGNFWFLDLDFEIWIIGKYGCKLKLCPIYKEFYDMVYDNIFI